MPAGDHQDDRREGHRTVLQNQRLDVARQVMHGYERDAMHRGHRLRECHANQQRADQPWPLGHGNRPEGGRVHVGFLQRPLDHAADVAQVLTRGELRDHAAPFAVNRDL